MEVSNAVFSEYSWSTQVGRFNTWLIRESTKVNQLVNIINDCKHDILCN